MRADLSTRQAPVELLGLGSLWFRKPDFSLKLGFWLLTKNDSEGELEKLPGWMLTVFLVVETVFGQILWDL
jgi:hypothetical protein